MEVLRLGLLIGALACVYVSWASWSAGYPPEIALVRGLVGFVAVSIVAYLGELIVATAPARSGAATASGDPQAAATRTNAARQVSEPSGAAPTVRAPITGEAPADDQMTEERVAA